MRKGKRKPHQIQKQVDLPVHFVYMPCLYYVLLYLVVFNVRFVLQFIKKITNILGFV